MTYAAHHFARPDTLADMQERRSHYLSLAAAADFNNEPSIACMWEDMARQEESNIALREDAERRFAWSRIPVHAIGDQDTGPRGWGMAFGIVAIVAAITMGIPAVCWLWAWLGGAL